MSYRTYATLRLSVHFPDACPMTVDLAATSYDATHAALLRTCPWLNHEQRVDLITALAIGTTASMDLDGIHIRLSLVPAKTACTGHRHRRA